jgi:glutamine cyclotransferase
MNYLKITTAIVIATIFSSCDTDKPKDIKKVDTSTTVEVPETPVISYSLVNTHPHDVNAFTEGLLFHEGKLFESTGAPENLPQTKSLFGIVDLKNGKIDTKVEIDKAIYFGEGISILNNKIYQLTYKNQTAFVYDAKTYKPIGKYSYQNKEGWGLTNDGKNLIMSDGSNYLTFFDQNFNVTKTLDVSENGYAVDYLNELEYIKGFIYANIYQSHEIVKIDPSTGNVVGKLDLTSLFQTSKTKNINTLETNGIAYDSISDKILVTGKMWPSIYEIKFSH